jgi:hypothetical protein
MKYSNKNSAVVLYSNAKSELLHELPHRSSLSLGTVRDTASLHLSCMKLSLVQSFLVSNELSEVSPLSRIILFLCYKEISPQA